MKKTLKELLWFVISIILIVAIIVVLYVIADSQINTPKWMGMYEYFLLFSKSPDFAEIVLNTTLYNAVPALVMASIVFAVQIFVKMKRPLYYGIMAVTTALATLCLKVFYLNPKFLGLPYTSYPADTIIAKPEEITVTAIDMLKAVTLYDVLQSLLIATITCFVFWLIEQATKAIRKRIAK